MASFYGWDPTASRLDSHYKEAVYFIPLSSEEFLVLIWLTLEGWKTESTLEPPSGLLHSFKFIFDSIFCRFFESFASMIIFNWSPLLISRFFKNFFFYLFFNISFASKMHFQFYMSVKTIHLFT